MSRSAHRPGVFKIRIKRLLSLYKRRRIELYGSSYEYWMDCGKFDSWVYAVLFVHMKKDRTTGLASAGWAVSLCFALSGWEPRVWRWEWSCCVKRSSVGARKDSVGVSVHGWWRCSLGDTSASWEETLRHSSLFWFRISHIACFQQSQAGIEVVQLNEHVFLEVFQRLTLPLDAIQLFRRQHWLQLLAKRLNEFPAIIGDLILIRPLIVAQYANLLVTQPMFLHQLIVHV